MDWLHGNVMDDLKKLLENAGMIEHGGGQEQHVMQANQDKVVKTLIGAARAMDKADRPGVDNPSKSNISTYINFQLEQIIDELQTQGYDINWEEKDWTIR